MKKKAGYNKARVLSVDPGEMEPCFNEAGKVPSEKK